MSKRIGAEFGVGDAVKATVAAKFDGYTVKRGEVGECIAVGRNGDPTVLVEFAGRPPLCCTPGDDCAKA